MHELMFSRFSYHLTRMMMDRRASHEPLVGDGGLAAVGRPRLCGCSRRRLILFGGSFILLGWLVGLSVAVGRSQSGGTIAPATQAPAMTSLQIASVGCGTSNPQLMLGSPVSFSEKESGKLVIGAGTSSYMGGVKLDFGASVTSIAKPNLLALDSNTALLTYAVPGAPSAGYSIVVVNGGIPSSTPPGTAMQWLNGQTVQVGPGTAAPVQLPFVADDAQVVPQAFSAGDYLVVYVGQGAVWAASVSPTGDMLLGPPTNLTASGDWSVDAQLTALDAGTFAVSYYDAAPGGSTVLRVVVGSVDTASLGVALSVPVAYAADHEFHSLTRIGPNVLALSYPLDNATAIINDDEEAVGFPMAVLLASYTLTPAAVPGGLLPLVSIWGRKGPGGAAGQADQTAAVPWSYAYVRAHSFYAGVAAPMPAQVVAVSSATLEQSSGTSSSISSGSSILRGSGSSSSTRLRNAWKAQRSAGALLSSTSDDAASLASAAAAAASAASSAAVGAGASAGASLVSRQFLLLTVIDAASSDAVRALGVEIYLAGSAVGQAGAIPAYFNVTGVDVLWGDSLAVTPGGASGRYTGMTLTPFAVLPVATASTGTVHFAVALPEMSALGAATAHIFTLHTLDGRLSLPYARHNAPGSVVDTTGVPLAAALGGDPLAAASPLLVDSTALPGTSSALFVVIAPAAANGGKLAANITMVEHLPAPCGVVAFSGSYSTVCQPGQTASVIMMGSTPGGTALNPVLQPAGQTLPGGLQVYSTTRGYLSWNRVYTWGLGGTAAVDVAVGSDSTLGLSLADSSLLIL